MKFLIDTCVLLDVIEKREPFFDESYAFLKSLSSPSNNQGYLCVKQVCDLDYLARHFFHNDKMARNFIEKILKVFHLLDNRADECLLALEAPMPDFEDALLSESAKTHGIDFIVTRNLSDYQNSPVLAIDPKEALEKVN
jgi:predicted nucleic acid-binding protein